MNVPPQHQSFLHQAGYPVPASSNLTEQERSLLSRYGRWMEALASGELAPITPEQQRFVRVARGEEPPLSAFEVAWEKRCRAAAESHDPASLPGGDPLELPTLCEEARRAKEAALALSEEYQARREAILALVRPQLEALETEYSERLRAAGDEVTRLEADVREAVLAYGSSFKHAGVQAVYTRGRVSWDGKGLSRYLADHPEIGEFRRVGRPSVGVRYRLPEGR